MTGYPAVLLVAAAVALAGLAVLVLVDKRRPLRHLDDQPPQVGDDLDRMTDERIAAESRLHRKAR
ncbi:hypothetical protein ACQPXB_36115 [Amycolatopsis sp. CA-161197]|uniref:hypothetical protein n=1 Tax=Amycolatopsis sp. CA-161197 TaxID=3239922 RepID=UPI003D8FCD41